MILKEIHIKNFKSHKDTKLKLHPGVNVITGIGLSGKTPIIDAIKWLVTNRPLGNRFKSRFNQNRTTKVTCVFSDNITATLEKRKQSKYKISGKITNTACSFGPSVPEEISEAINLSDINFSEQFDPPLLVTSTPTVIRQTINKITDQEASEGWRLAINNSLNTFKAQLKLSASDAKLARKKIKRFKGLSEIGKYIKKYENIAKEIEESDQLINMLQRFVIVSEEVSQIENNIGYFEEVHNQLKIVAAKEETTWQEIELFEEIESLEKEIHQIEKKLNEEKKALHKLKSCPLCNSTLTTKMQRNLIATIQKENSS